MLILHVANKVHRGDTETVYEVDVTGVGHSSVMSDDDDDDDDDMVIRWGS